jgi:uncharacterized protein (TIGR03437 family)
MRALPLILLLVAATTASAQTYTVSTFAGGGLPIGVPGLSATLDSARAIAVDASGDVFFAQSAENIVLRLDAKTGILSLVAGNGTPGFSGDDGLAVNAQLNTPAGLAVDSAGDLFISDSGNRRVRKVTNGVITTIAGGGTSTSDNVPAISYALFNPQGIAVDASGALYIADLYPVGSNSQAIRKVFPASGGGVITTAVGNLYGPIRVAVDVSENLYIVDGIHRDTRVIKVSPSGQMQTLAAINIPGESPMPESYLIAPQGIAVDSAGTVYVADDGDSRVVILNGGGHFTTIAGTGGPAANTLLNNPQDVAVDPAGNLYIADSRIFKLAGGVLSTIAGTSTPDIGDGAPATSAHLNSPFGVAVDAAGNVFISDVNNSRVREVSAATHLISTVAQVATPYGIAVDSSGALYVTDPILNVVRKFTAGVGTIVAGKGGLLGALGDGGPATSAILSHPYGVWVDPAGNNLYIADTGNNRIRKVSNGVITTLLGDGTTAQVNAPNAVTGDSAGNIYIADTGNNRILKISTATGAVSTVTAIPSPNGIALDAAGNLYITSGQTVQKLSNGVLYPIADATSLTGPEGIAADAAGNIYVADYRAGTAGVVRLLTSPSPHIAANGIVPVYSSSPVIQPGSWVSLYGSGLAAGTSLWNGDFPTSLGGVSVIINNKPAYLWFVSPGQINLQAPDDSTVGLVSVAVTTPSGTATSTVTLAPQSPSFSLLGDGKHVAAQIMTSAATYYLLGPLNTFSCRTRPAKAGETLVLYGVGFGPTAPPIPAGKTFSGSAPLSGTVMIAIGGVKATVTYAGLTQAGLYQFNVIVPAVSSGDQPLQATVNGIQSPPGALVAIQ